MLFILILAVILGVDSFAACLSMGMCNANIKKSRAWLLFASIGLFHFFMPIIGYFLSEIYKNTEWGFGKYLSAIIFIFLGIKMVAEGIKSLRDKDPECNESNSSTLSLKSIILLSFVLSIDAIVAGFSVSIIETGLPQIVIPILFSIFAFAMSAIGFYSGKYLNRLVGVYSNIVAGVIMLLLAAKTITI